MRRTVTSASRATALGKPLDGATPTGFHALHRHLRNVRGLVRIEAHHGAHPPLHLWTREDREQVTSIIRETFTLLDGQKSARKSTYANALEDCIERHLHHRMVIFKFGFGCPRPRGAGQKEEMEAYEACAEEIMALLWALTTEFTNANAPALKGSPDSDREYIALRLGRTRGGVDQFVSEWRSEHGVDLPWVVRKLGLPWLANLAEFERWRATSERLQAPLKRPRGRPRKVV